MVGDRDQLVEFLNDDLEVVSLFVVVIKETDKSGCFVPARRSKKTAKEFKKTVRKLMF